MDLCHSQIFRRARPHLTITSASNPSAFTRDFYKCVGKALDLPSTTVSIWAKAMSISRQEGLAWDVIVGKDDVFHLFPSGFGASHDSTTHPAAGSSPQVAQAG